MVCPRNVAGRGCNEGINRRPSPPDVVWLLFLMKDLSNLDLASRMLGHVERGFRKAHGPGLERLTALKGEHCAENLLYVRLHLLQASVTTSCCCSLIFYAAAYGVEGDDGCGKEQRRVPVHARGRRMAGVVLVEYRTGKFSGRGYYFIGAEWRLATVCAATEPSFVSMAYGCMCGMCCIMVFSSSLQR